MRSKNIIICILCSLIIVMVAGYAAFATALNINGTASIISDWDVHFESITAGSIQGQAQDLTYDETLNPNGTRLDGTTAYFKTELVSPGDSITYTVTVKNSGTIDARLDSITTQQPENTAIVYSVSGIKENDILAVSDSKTLILTVSYDSNITSQPNILTSSLTVTLDFVQA